MIVDVTHGDGANFICDVSRKTFGTFQKKAQWWSDAEVIACLTHHKHLGDVYWMSLTLARKRIYLREEIFRESWPSVTVGQFIHTLTV